MGGGKRKVAVEADPKHNPKAVYDLIDKLDPPPFHVTQAEIRVTFFAPLPGTLVDTSHVALLRMREKRQRGSRAMGYRIAEPSA